MNDPSGILILDKPSGPTSHDVVNRVRRALGTRKVGHGGTLDPAATGVLLVGVGRATRLLAFLQPLPKTYRASVRFGITTTTEDAQGEIVLERLCSFERADLEREAALLIGEIEQKPPMVSAVKVDGEPLYRAARRGELVERRSRKVRVYELAIEDFTPDDPAATLFTRVSGGTYVRTLAAELGERLGCGGHITSLRRLAVGSFTEDEAIALPVLEERGVDCMLPMREALRDFPQVTVKDDEEAAVRHGRPLTDRAVRSGEMRVGGVAGAGGVPAHLAGMSAGIPVGVFDVRGNLLAVYRRTRRDLKPAAVLVTDEREP